MMYTAAFRPEASDDIKHAYQWYESVRPGLGEDFLLMIEEAIARIEREPYAFACVYKSVRRKLLRRFPYGIFFVVEEGTVVILAVLHFRQAPETWQSRT